MDFISPENRIHIFPHRKSKNGVFQKETIEEWIDFTKEKKVTKIFIPVTEDEKIALLDFYNNNIPTPSYDYSFFGHRCASSVYNALKGINKIKGGNYYFNAFYPGQLRKNIVKQSGKNNYIVTVKSGSKKRVWEGK